MSTTDASASHDMVPVADAIRGAIDEAQRQLDLAHRKRHAITAMAIAALRQRELTDAYIRTLLDIDADTMAAASQPLDLSVDGVQDWELRSDIEALWTAVRRQASPWMQTDDVTTSAQVVERHDIDPGSWPLAVRALDTPGAEFIHQSNGHKIVVYSLQGRDGTPTIVNDAIESWDHRGEYHVEFVTGEGLRSRLDLSKLSLVRSAFVFSSRASPRDALLNKTFRRVGAAGTKGDATEAFERIVTTIRRMSGPLPPYSEAVSLIANGAPG